MSINKEMLFIAPLFFNYYKEIMKELELIGFNVDYICDAPSNSNFFKAISRINKKLTHNQNKKYFTKQILPKISQKKYDCIFVIVGMTFSFSPDMFEVIKKYNPNAKFIMYQWDGEKNISFIKDFHKFFDEIYTFDRYDCLENKNYKFLPLFYTHQYEDIGKNKITNYTYDVSYIGTAHPQKYKLINEMSEKLKEKLPKQFIYHYMPSKLKFFYHKLTSKEYKNAKLEDFKLEKVPLEETIEIFKNSKSIFDAPQAGQTGLTIRSIECLGAKRKLITTNKDIVNYDFYCEQNILVYNENINYNSAFFTEDFKDIPESIYIKYSLREWLKLMLKDVLEEK